MKTTGYLELVRGNANFRYIWLGEIVSMLGDWFNLIASATLIARLTGSGAAVGGLFVLRMVAPFLVSLLAGVAADRYNRKQILIWSDILRGLVVLGFFLVREAGDVWLLYVLTTLQLGIGGLFFPARSAILPDLVREDELGAANTLSSATWSTMLAFGAAIGGIVSGSFGVYTAFGVDALTFFVSAWMIMQIRYVQPPISQTEQRGMRGVLATYVEGLQYLLNRRDLLAIVLHKSFVSLLMFVPFQVLFVALSESRYVYGVGGGIGLGIMYAMVGVGTGISPLLGRWFTGDDERRLRLAIGVCYLIGLAGSALTGLLGPFWFFLLGCLIRGLGTGAIWVYSTQLIYQSTSEQVRGRTFATDFALFTIAGALGAALTGWAVDTLGGIAPVIWGMVALWLIPTFFWFWWIGFGVRKNEVIGMGDALK
ncbi:MAG: MFS transporter [Caldilineaceae bacterium]